MYKVCKKIRVCEVLSSCVSVVKTVVLSNDIDGPNV